MGAAGIVEGPTEVAEVAKGVPDPRQTVADLEARTRMNVPIRISSETPKPGREPAVQQTTLPVTSINKL